MMWSEKRYHSFDYYLKETFGQKVYKLSINGGMTCPNRDGTLGTGGCIFCSSGGSGDFASNAADTISEQLRCAKQKVSKKINDGRYIAYFQAFTNTYAPVSYLRKIFYQAIKEEDIVALSIATRPDCLPKDVLELLEELNHIKPVWVELGLQTCNEATARLINRRYDNSVFEDAVKKLRKKNLSVIVHIILGLPWEDKQDMLKTISYVTSFDIQGMKLQLMHILKGTKLAALYEETPEAFALLDMNDYVDVLTSCIERIPPQIDLHRITGDGPKQYLIAPLWSGNKKNVLNTIQKELKQQNTYQGKYYIERGQ